MSQSCIHHCPPVRLVLITHCKSLVTCTLIQISILAKYMTTRLRRFNLRIRGIGDNKVTMDAAGFVAWSTNAGECFYSTKEMLSLKFNHFTFGRPLTGSLTTELVPKLTKSLSSNLSCGTCQVRRWLPPGHLVNSIRSMNRGFIVISTNSKSQFCNGLGKSTYLID